MIPKILEYMVTHYDWAVPSAFFYTSTRVILAAFCSLLLSILLGPLFIRKLYEMKIGQPIRDFTEFRFLLADLHKNKKNTPTMGGVLIIFSCIVSAVLWCDLKSPFTWWLIVSGVTMGLLGAVDDLRKLRNKSFKGLSGKTRLFVQFIFSAALLSYFYFPEVAQFGSSIGIVPPKIVDTLHLSTSQSSLALPEFMARFYIPFIKYPILFTSTVGVLFIILLDMIVISGSCNAVNLTDGLDGLAAGCSILVVSVLCLFGFVSNNAEFAQYLNILSIEGSGEISVFLAAVSGACLGFLWYNSHPAQVFMGDTGSLALGAIIGTSAVLLKREGLLALIGAIFVAETVSVILQVASFKLTGKRIFRCAPLHHHFEYEGMHESKVVIRFWIFGLLLSLAGLVSLKFQ